MKIFNYFIVITILFFAIIFISGCIIDEKVTYDNVTKSELFERAKTSLLGLGLEIAYEDESRGIIQAVKRTAGGTSGYLLPIGDKTFGGFSSKPEGVSDLISLVIYDADILIKIDGDTLLFSSIFDRMSIGSGRFYWTNRTDGIKTIYENGAHHRM